MRNLDDLLAAAGADLDPGPRRLLALPLHRRKQPRSVERDKGRGHLYLADEALAIGLDLADKALDIFVGIKFEVPHLNIAHFPQREGFLQMLETR